MKKIYVLLLLSLCISSVTVFAADQKVSSSCLLITSTLRVGSRDSATGGQVTKLQQFLKEKGYLSLPSTGYFGVLTKNAVQSFQKERALEAVGFVGPATRSVITFTSCSTSSQVALLPTPLSPSIDIQSNELKAYQVFVDNKIQIDASSVSKTYADESCKKMAESNRSHALTCVWGNKEIYVHSAPSGGEVTAQEPAVVAQPVVSAQTPSTVVESTVSSGAPSVLLLIAPISVPYGGGYDSFELKTIGMSSCTLYFKDEPSKKWISGGSSLGVNFSLPGYRGMTTSKSFYTSCIDASSKIFDSEIVKITVAGS